MNIILISGKANSGKGTIGKVIKNILLNKNKHVIVCSLSTYIRDIAKNDFYWDGIDTLESRIFMGEVYRVGSDFYPYHMARRVWERDIEPYATKESTAIIESFREKVNYDYFLSLKEEGKIDNITTVRVIRPNFNAIQDEEFENHVSEADLDDFIFNHTVENSGTIEELYDKLKETF